jgi:hypothetical protein
MTSIHTWNSGHVSARTLIALCALCIAALWCVLVARLWVDVTWLQPSSVHMRAPVSSAQHGVNFGAYERDGAVEKPTDPLSHIRKRWDSMWRADATAADLNLGNLHIAQSLIHRADAGDLEATTDIIGAAMWCLSAGSMVNVTDFIQGERRPCYERFGASLSSRERLERAAFAWVLALASAGMDDAVLYASALARGLGSDLFGGADIDEQLREMQQAQLLGQLQSMAMRGSAEAASELNGHYGGTSSLVAADTALSVYYARLTEQLDPTRSAMASAQ